MLNATVIPPFAHLLAWLLDDEVEEWDTIDEIKSNLIPALLRRPLELLGNLFDGFTGGDTEDVVSEGITFGASLLAKLFAPAQSLMDALFSGYTGTVSSGATVSDLSSTMSSVDSRITALEGGGTRYYLTASTTLDLSGKSMVRALLWGSSQTPVTGTGRWGDAAGVDGGYLCYEISAALFEDYGVDMSAVEVVVGTAGAASKIGKTGTWIAQTVPGRARIGTAQGLIEAEGPGSGGAGGRGSNGDTGAGTGSPTAGGAGVPTTLAPTSGTGGGTTGGNGNPGGNGTAVDVDIPGPKTGGSGGGGGGGGKLVAVVPYAGGNGGHGGFPGGGPGGGGGPGKYIVYASRGTPGSRANGVVVLEVY